MTKILIALVVGVIIVGYFLLKRGKKPESFPDLIARQGEQKRIAKAAIRTALVAQQKITNDEVQKLLGISDATATRYLQELESENIIRQVGDVGSGVYYEKAS